MSALLHAAFLLIRDTGPQWVDRPHLSPSIISSSAADFSIPTSTSALSPPSSNAAADTMMDGGVIYDVYPTTTSTSTFVAAAITAAGKATAVAASAATASAQAVAASTTNDDDDDNGECRLLGSFALFVQLALGGLALMSLVYKRWRERPQRPVKIWFFDASKQVFGSVLVHVANVFMSMLTSGRFSIKVEPVAVSTAARLIKRVAGGDDGEYVPNPCSFYLLNLAIDTTLGIPILILLLRIFTALVAKTKFGQPAESIQSGNYGNPPKAWWWLKQSLIYFCGLFGMKFCVLIIFVMLPWISRVGDWALRWTEGNEKVQIVFVMMLFPLIMNALQYYIIDSFIKKQTPDEETEGQGHPGSDGVLYQSLPEGSPDGLDAAHQLRVDDTDVKTPVRKSVPSTPVREEYDPEVDGDRSALGSSSSSSNREQNKVSTELLPKE